MVSSQDGSDILVLFWQEFVSERCYSFGYGGIFKNIFMRCQGRRLLV